MPTPNALVTRYPEHLDPPPDETHFVNSTPSNSTDSAPPVKKAPSLPGFFSRYQDRIDDALRAELVDLEPDIYDIHRYYMGWQEIDGSDSSSTGGKRMRPTLALLAADAVYPGCINTSPERPLPLDPFVFPPA